MGRLDVYSDCSGSQQVSISFVGVGRTEGSWGRAADFGLNLFSTNNDDSATTQQASERLLHLTH
jgi:hypothetical protein